MSVRQRLLLVEEVQRRLLIVRTDSERKAGNAFEVQLRRLLAKSVAAGYPDPGTIYGEL